MNILATAKLLFEFSVPPPHTRGTAHSWCGKGVWFMPIAGATSSSSGETPALGVKLKCCRRVVMKMKSSILARLSPGHALRPAREYIKLQVSCQEGRILTKQSFLLSQTCGKRHEGISLDKLPIFIQEVGGMKGVWTLPLSVITQDGWQERIHCGPL